MREWLIRLTLMQPYEWSIIIVPCAVNGIGAILVWLVVGRPKLTWRYWRYPDEYLEAERRRELDERRDG